MLLTESSGLGSSLPANDSPYRSLAQSRTLYPSFLASSTASASSFGRTTSRMTGTQSDTMVHFLPSHCSKSTGPEPSWSSQVTLTGCVKPFMPSSSRRLSVRFRCSNPRSEEHTSELQSQSNLVCRLLLEKKKKKHYIHRGYSTISKKPTQTTTTSLTRSSRRSRFNPKTNSPHFDSSYRLCIATPYVHRTV